MGDSPPRCVSVHISSSSHVLGEGDVQINKDAVFLFSHFINCDFNYYLVVIIPCSFTPSQKQHKQSPNLNPPGHEKARVTRPSKLTTKPLRSDSVWALSLFPLSRDRMVRLYFGPSLSLFQSMFLGTVGHLTITALAGQHGRFKTQDRPGLESCLESGITLMVLWLFMQVSLKRLHIFTLPIIELSALIVLKWTDERGRCVD